VGEDYYRLIKHHLKELHTRYRTPVYQLLDITWKISQEQRWELYRLIKSLSPDCIVVMNQAFYQAGATWGEPANKVAGRRMSSTVKTRFPRQKDTSP